MRFTAGIVDASEVVGRWDAFIMHCVTSKAPAKRSQYRNAIVAMACMILWVPGPSWRRIDEIKKNLGMSNIPR